MKYDICTAVINIQIRSENYHVQFLLICNFSMADVSRLTSFLFPPLFLIFSVLLYLERHSGMWISDISGKTSTF